MKIGPMHISIAALLIIVHPGDPADVSPEDELGGPEGDVQLGVRADRRRVRAQRTRRLTLSRKPHDRVATV